ncbi:predicted protein [Methanosarcina acetivorans C2A]|uniref:Uncharacterized protein n=2 Tax=Methanosarcina acetivorans TaxID=2214 RepID=Q8TN10_METAC|nr:predicted protein [Methanosarcina acetivorans C2A]
MPGILLLVLLTVAWRLAGIILASVLVAVPLLMWTQQMVVRFARLEVREHEIRTGERGACDPPVADLFLTPSVLGLAGPWQVSRYYPKN